MRKPLCIGSSDWHLERNAWVRHPELYGDSYYGLSQVVDLCLKYRVPLIGAGDLFDKPYPDSHSVWVAMQEMDRMKEANLRVFFTQGQHERAKDTPWLSLHPWPTYIHNMSVGLRAAGTKMLSMIGLDYTKPHELFSVLGKITREWDIQLLVCHQVWRNFMGSCVTADGRLEEIPIEGGLILTGDYHKHCQIKVTPEIGNRSNTVLSPGSICLQSIDEPADKSVYLIYDDLTYDSIPLKSRSVFYHELTKEQDLEDFLAVVNTGWLEPQIGVPDNIARPILSVRYSPDIPEVYKRVTEGVGEGRAHLFVRPITRELDERTVEVGAAQETIDLGLEGNLAKLCQKDSKTYAIAQRLLSSTSPEDELDLLENEYLEGNK